MAFEIVELEPCPFCGIEPELTRSELNIVRAPEYGSIHCISTTWTIRCPKCFTKKEAVSLYAFQADETIRTVVDGRNKVVDLWNRRACK